MLQTILAIFFGVLGIVCLFLAFFTLAASGLGHGPGKVERRVIVLSFGFGVTFEFLALWLAVAL